MANSFTVNTYNPSDVQLIIGGYQLTGWGTITITRTKKSFVTIPGIRGKNTRVEVKDTSATISIPLLQTSQSNDVLSYIHELDIDEKTARIALVLKDNSGRSIFSSDQAYITGYPSVTFSDNFEYRQWEIFCETTGTYSIGGNARPTTSVFDSILRKGSEIVGEIF